MKILVSSYKFYPDIGGIETVSSILASEFTRAGHEVKIVTCSQGADERRSSFQVIRKPNPARLLKEVKWCDVFFHNNISLSTAWPLVLIRRPWVIAHHTWITRPDGKISWRDRLKMFLSRSATNICISKAIACGLKARSVIIPDTYEDSIFLKTKKSSRDRELVFVGRLVSDKGVDVLINALGIMRKNGHFPGLAVIGEGPELPGLKRLAESTGVSGQVEFMGKKSGEEINVILNASKILVVPSRWREPFGVVALEGIAAGCVVVGSEEGGLKDAIGPCGETFPNGDSAALAAAIARLLDHPEELEKYAERSEEHLLNFRKNMVAQTYLNTFEKVLNDTVKPSDGQ